MENYYYEDEKEKSILGLTANGLKNGLRSFLGPLSALISMFSVVCIAYLTVKYGKTIFGFITNHYYVVYVIPVILFYLTLRLSSKGKDDSSEVFALLTLIAIIFIVLVEIKGYGFINSRNKEIVEPKTESRIEYKKTFQEQFKDTQNISKR